ASASPARTILERNPSVAYKNAAIGKASPVAVSQSLTHRTPFFENKVSEKASVPFFAFFAFFEAQ
ncbi:MAG: hypothetical protein ACM336_08170, partial [Acidobacteriota bacterium]